MRTNTRRPAAQAIQQADHAEAQGDQADGSLLSVNTWEVRLHCAPFDSYHKYTKEKFRKGDDRHSL
jgi:hypothetical protein